MEEIETLEHGFHETTRSALNLKGYTEYSYAF